MTFTSQKARLLSSKSAKAFSDAPSETIRIVFKNGERLDMSSQEALHCGHFRRASWSNIASKSKY
jgi:hypothetical protein